MRRATGADVDAIATFLRNRIESSMFPLSNLIGHGLGRDHPLALRIWLDGQGDAVNGLVALTESGSLLPQLPEPLMADAAGAMDGETFS